jgi:hypothetical protein
VENLGLEVAKAAITVAMSSSREEEAEHIERFREKSISAAGVDIGGNLIDSIPKIIERAVIASRRSGITVECFAHDGAVAGAAREAIVQVYPKASGLNVGGKLSIARLGGHLTVCIFMNVGLLHLNEVVVGMGHRSISD